MKKHVLRVIFSILEVVVSGVFLFFLVCGCVGVCVWRCISKKHIPGMKMSSPGTFIRGNMVSLLLYSLVEKGQRFPKHIAEAY